MAPAIASDVSHKRKRRRKKARTEDFSSDSDSDLSTNSDSSSGSAVVSKRQDESDNENYSDIDMDLDVGTTIDADAIHPKLQLSNELNDATKEVSASRDNKEFEELYTSLMVKEFGDDLSTLRQSNDFQSKSLYLLIEALKDGANIFDERQRKEILTSQKT